MSEKKIIILTGSEIRHEFFSKCLSSNDKINVAAIYCEGFEKSLGNTLAQNPESSDLEYQHFHARTQSELDFFNDGITSIDFVQAPKYLRYGSINEKEVVRQILSHDADLIACYGCSLIGQDLLKAYSGRIINAHLGLSPYYRGSGTNVWPLIENEPDLVGVTFMHMDSGIDTGEIIHQIRARVFVGDSPHTIGNRLIKDMCGVFAKIITEYDNLKSVPQPNFSGKVYKISDFNAYACRKLYDNFNKGLVENYLGINQSLKKIIVNPSVDS